MARVSIRDVRRQGAWPLVGLFVLACGRGPGPVPPVDAVVVELARLRTASFQEGRDAKARTQLLAYLSASDKSYGTQPACNVARARALEALEDFDAARASVDLVPDDHLELPSDLVNRLQVRYRSDVPAALALVKRLASSGDPRAWPALGRWLHQARAGQFAPVPRTFATIRTRRFDAT